MEQNNYKTPWSCEELVQHAGKWSLAGNVGLLKHMENFAENVLQHADETYTNLESLMNDLGSAEIQLDLVKNQFLGLQNTQFIESRVYDEDETINTHIDEPKNQKGAEPPKHLIAQNVVLDGLQVLEKYYERVSIPESDSEGDEPDCPNYVLHEKDPYINRPLPYIIGTDEWHTKWHAGLEESSEDDDDLPDKNVSVEDEFSDTDSESNLPIADRRAYSKEFINNNILDNSINTQLDDDINYAEVNGNSSVPVQAPIANATFAEQLAAKLGDVLTTNVPNGNQNEEVNTRPIQRRPFSSSLLPEVPPQLSSDIEDAPKHGMFSSDGGLFDDEVVKPPPIFPTSKQINSKTKVPNLFDDDDTDDDLVVPPSVDKVSSPPKKSVRGLFDESDDDEDMFSTTNNNIFPKLPKTGPVFMPQEPPELKKSPPIGGVKVLGGILPQRRVSSSSSTSSSNEQSDKVQSSGAQGPAASMKSSTKITSYPSATLSSNAPIVNKPSNKKVISLFDDTDNLFEDDLFTDINSVMKKPLATETSKKHTNLFGADETDEEIPPPIFSSVGPESSNTKKMHCLFEDSGNEEASNVVVPTNLFNDNISSAKSLFDDNNANISDHDFWLSSHQEKELINDKDLKSDIVESDVEITKPVVDDTLSLLKTDDLTIDGLQPPVFKLFDDKPPLLTPDDNDDEDWDTKSRSSSSLSDKFGEPQLNLIEPTGQLNIDNNTLPDVPPFEVIKNIEETELHKNIQISSGDVVLPAKINIETRKSPGKLKHNLNINVNALMPGAKLIKSQPVENQPEPISSIENNKVDEFNTNNDNSTKDFDNNNKMSPPHQGDEVEVLQSVTKNRPRIMVKRKPSTRQGRLAALEKTKSPDDNSGKDDVVSNQNKQIVIANEPIKIVENDTISTSDTISTIISKSIEELKDKDCLANLDLPKKTSLLFEDDDIVSNDAISNMSSNRAYGNINKKENLGTPKKLLIVDDDLDESTKSPELALPVSKERTEVKKISLFDDDDTQNEDEDIFASAAIFSGNITNPPLPISSTNVGNVRVYNTTLDDIPKPPTIFNHGVSNKKPGISGALDNMFGGPKSTKDDDLFKKILPPTKSFTQKSFLEEDDDLSDDLFGPVKTTVVTSKAHEPVKTITSELKKKSLFDDEDDDDLFGGSKMNPVVNDNKDPIGKVQSEPVKGKGKSLFGDEDEDDDLFAFNKTTSKPAVRKFESNKTTNVLTKSKLSTAKVTQPVKDPLDALLGDSD